MGAKLSAKQIEERAQAFNPQLRLIHETYIRRTEPCQWVEKGYGEFIRTPHQILFQGMWYHPDHAVEVHQKNRKEGHSKPEVLLKREQTTMERYGVRNATMLPHFRDKVKKTNLERYGVEHLSHSPEIRKKAQQTTFENYGVLNPGESIDLQNKAKTTNLERYGVEYTFQAKEVKEKIRETHLGRYGFEYTMQNPEFLEKRRQTFLQRYGAEHSFQVPEMKEKAENTNLERYGFKHPSKSEQFKVKVKATNIARYGVEHTMQSTTVKEKSKKTMLAKYGVEHGLQSPEIKEKAFRTTMARGLLNRSRAEIEIHEFCKTLDLKARSTMAYLKDKAFQIDIFLPDREFCIEYNGMYRHAEGVSGNYPNKHLDKSKACELKGRRLIHIWEDEWKHRPDRVRAYIKRIFGTFDETIQASECFIAIIHDKNVAHAFLRQNGLLGSCTFEFALGMYHNGRLVGLACVGRHRKTNILNVIERIVFLDGARVIDGLGQLSRSIFDHVPSDTLITWTERRLGVDPNYESAGWKREADTRPAFFYWDNSKKHRMSKKDCAAKPDLKAKILRVWDCGKVRFRLTRSASQPRNNPTP